MPTPIPSEIPWPEWFHSAVPNELQWIGLVLTIIALAVGLMALPTVFQMIWGRPSLEIGFSSFDNINEAARYLNVQIFNRPVRSKILRAIGVARPTATDFMVRVEIQEDGTNLMIRQRTPYLDYLDEPARRLGYLPASHTPARAAIVMFSGEDQSAHIVEDDQIGSVLAPGRYRALAEIAMGERRFRGERRFIVGSTMNETRWE